MLDERLEHGARFRRIARLVVQIGGLQRRLALHVRRLGRSLRDLLEFGRRLPRMVRLRVRHRELARHVGLQRALREIAPEALEHHDGAIPLLLRDEQRAGIEIRVGAHLRGRRHLRDAQEILHRAGAVARLALLLALLVDRGREPLDDRGALRIVRRHQRLGARVTRFRLVEMALLEIRVGDHGVGDALLGGVDRRLTGEQRLRGRGRARIVLRGIQIRRGARQHLRALRVRREGPARTCSELSTSRR